MTSDPLSEKSETVFYELDEALDDLPRFFAVTNPEDGWLPYNGSGPTMRVCVYVDDVRDMLRRELRDHEENDVPESAPQPLHAIAQQHIESASQLLNNAARILAKWGAEADRVVTSPLHYREGPALMSSMSDSTLEDRCNLAKMVGDRAAELAGWAEQLGEAGQ